MSGKLQRRRKRLRLADTSLVDALLGILPAGCSVIDIGAGTGRYVEALRLQGFLAGGIDGTPEINSLSNGLVFWADLTNADTCRPFVRCADWGIFLEVGEHVPQEYEKALLDNVSSMPRVGLIASWAQPGQRGSGHVNNRPREYVTTQFENRGWIMDTDNQLHNLAVFRR